MHIVDSMEITKVFKACVKAARAKNKDLSSPSDILKPFRKKDDSSFNNKLLDVVRNITKLRDFLLKHRKDYLGNNYIVMSSTMTNEERDQIDNDAQVFMKSCYAAIGGMRKEASTFKDSSQFQEHVSVVLELVDVYLKDICKLYSQQRAFRVKQAVDKKRLLRLCPEGKREATNNDASASQGARINATTYKKEVKTSEIRERETRSPLSEIDSLEEDSDEPLGTSESSPTSEKPRNESVASNQQSSDIHLEDSKKPEAAVLSKEEMQLFEEENETLYAEMNNLVDEVCCSFNIDMHSSERGLIPPLFLIPPFR